MVTRNINLTPQQDEYVRELVASGEYQNASETVRDALRALKQRRIEERQKLKALRAAITEGIASIEAGDYVEVTDTKAFFAEMLKSVIARHRGGSDGKTTGRAGGGGGDGGDPGDQRRAVGRGRRHAVRGPARGRVRRDRG